MDRRELLKLFPAPEGYLGGLSEYMFSQDNPLDIEYEFEGFCINLFERPFTGGDIQFFAEKRIDGVLCRRWGLFPKGERIDDIKEAIREPLRRAEHRVRNRLVTAT